MSKRVYLKGPAESLARVRRPISNKRGLGREIQTSQILIQAKVFFYTAGMSCDTHTKPKERYINVPPTQS